jgi:hypothetical protein
VLSRVIGCFRVCTVSLQITVNETFHFVTLLTILLNTFTSCGQPIRNIKQNMATMRYQDVLSLALQHLPQNQYALTWGGGVQILAHCLNIGHGRFLCHYSQVTFSSPFFSPISLFLPYSFPVSFYVLLSYQKITSWYEGNKIVNAKVEQLNLWHQVDLHDDRFGNNVTGPWFHYQLSLSPQPGHLWGPAGLSTA